MISIRYEVKSGRTSRASELAEDDPAKEEFTDLTVVYDKAPIRLHAPCRFFPGA